MGAQAVDHSGICTGTFLAADNPHVLVGNCTVPAGDSLTLETGVVLDASSGSALSVDGTLLADSVTIDNASIDFRAGSAGAISNSTVTGSAPISVADSTLVAPAAPTLQANVIVATSGSAISVSGTAEPIIDANTITTTSGLASIRISGSSQPIITGNEITTNSRGLDYSGTAAGSASGNTIVFSGTTHDREGIYLFGDASPVVEGNTIGDDVDREDVGIELSVSAASTATVSNNQICVTGGDAPFRFGGGFFGAAMNATVTGNVPDPACDAFSGALLPSATLSTDTVLRVVNGVSSYALERLATWTVPADVTLTLQPAITLDVEGRGGFGLTVDGTLDVDGATVANADIDFRAGSEGTIGNNSTIIGASPISIADATGIEPTSPTIENSTITATSGAALTVSGFSEPTITGNTIETNSRGISYAGASGGTASGNTIQFVGTTSDREGIFLSGDASPLVDANVIGGRCGAQ